MTGSTLTAAQTRRIQKAVASVPYAHLLGIERSTLDRKIRRYELVEEKKGQPARE